MLYLIQIINPSKRFRKPIINIVTTIKKISAIALLVVGAVAASFTNIAAAQTTLISVSATANPATLTAEGGVVTFTYTVTNLGVAPLTGVTISDNKCTPLNGPTGDANGNSQLEANESWVYTCGAIVAATTTSTVTAQGTSGGLLHSATTTVTVTVADATLPATGFGPEDMSYLWIVFGAIMTMSALFFGLNVKKGF